MNLTLTRTRCSQEGIFGRLEADDGSFSAVTLEHSYDGAPKLPAGTYTCKRRLSPHFGYELFQIMNVPGHDFMEIHVGNYNHDSDGCVLVGDQVEGNMITQSRETFARLMQAQEGIDEFRLEVA